MHLCTHAGTSDLHTYMHPCAHRHVCTHTSLCTSVPVVCTHTHMCTLARTLILCPHMTFAHTYMCTHTLVWHTHRALHVPWHKCTPILHTHMHMNPCTHSPGLHTHAHVSLHSHAHIHARFAHIHTPLHTSPLSLCAQTGAGQPLTGVPTCTPRVSVAQALALLPPVAGPPSRGTAGLRTPPAAALGPGERRLIIN